MNVKTMVVAVTAMVCAVVQSQAVDFSNTLGDGDIANPNNWPDNTLPSTTDAVKMTQRITYKASEDVTFKSLVFNPTQSGTCKFDLSENDATVTLTGNGTGDGSPTTVFYDYQFNNSTIWLIGGKWNLTGAYSIFTAGHRKECKIIVTDNAQVSLAGYLMPGYQGTGANDRIVVTNGASITTRRITIGYVAGANNGVLEIAKDGTVNASDFVATETQSTVSGGTIYVHGANSKFVGASGKNVNIGYMTKDAKLILDDGASFTCGSLYVGNANSTSIAHDNLLVASNSTIKTFQALSIGHAGYNNSAEIYTTPVTVNGSFRVGRSAAASNNVVRLIGSETTLSYVSDTDAPFFESGCNNTLSFEGGASHSLITGADVTFSGSAHNNTLRISGSGSQVVKTAMKFYMSVANANSYANSIIVEDGGKFEFYDMFVCRQDHSLVVSNGTLTTARNDPNAYSLQIGYVPNGSTATTTNNALVIQGDSPKVDFRLTGLSLAHGSRLHFDIPASGVYADVPIKVINLRLTDDCTLSADVTDCLASLERGTRRTLTLAKMHTGTNGAGQDVGGNLTIPQTVLDAANAGLPEHCKFYIDGRKLMLKVSKPLGMVIMVM